MGGGEWTNQAQQVAQKIIVETPEVVVHIEDNTNYWWLLTIAVIPVALGIWFKKKGKK